MEDGLIRLSKEKRKKEVSMEDKYRATLLHSPYGPEVLTDLLIHTCHFGSTLDPDNPSQIAEYNVGISLLFDLGILSEDNAYRAVESMCRSRMPEPDKVQKNNKEETV